METVLILGTNVLIIISNNYRKQKIEIYRIKYAACAYEQKWKQQKFSNKDIRDVNWWWNCQSFRYYLNVINI